MRTSRQELTPKQRRRRRKAFFRQSLLAGCGLLLAAGVGLGLWTLLGREEAPPEPDPGKQVVAQQPGLPDEPDPVTPPAPDPQPEPVVGLAVDGEGMVILNEEIGSGYAVIIDADTNTVLAEKGGNAAIYPASMTKVLTILTAAEHIEDPEALFTMTQQIIDPHYRQGATITGYHSGDTCALRELFFGAALRSAADATTALAIAAGGTEEDFVVLMNETCDKLQLSESASFTNASGLFDSEHTCTLRDMAAIMRAAMANDLCRELMSTVEHVTAPTEAEPEGITFRNKYLGWFQEKQPEGVSVTACKSGYVQQAQNCLVSWGTNAEGRNFIVVTARGHNAETMMGDHRYLYSTFGQ